MTDRDGSGQGISAGWYDDGSGVMRWWNGTTWTEHVQRPNPTPVAPHAPSSAPTGTNGGTSAPWYMRKLTWVVAAAVVLVVAVASVSGGDGDGDGTTAGSPVAGQSTRPQADDSAAVEDATAEETEPADTDGDGANDDVDFAPKDPKIQTQDDVDTDGDRVPDYRDDFPKDAKYSKDSDGDGVADQLDDFPKDPEYSKDTDGDHVANTVDAYPADPSRWKITLAMENALGAAQDYLDYSAFSRQGLIDQLSSEYGSGFKVEDATWAVGQLHVDWKEQAVRSAKDYLNYTHFSRQGLIDQLSSPYGAQFTLEEATYAVNKLGL